MRVSQAMSRAAQGCVRHVGAVSKALVEQKRAVNTATRKLLNVPVPFYAWCLPTRVMTRVDLTKLPRPSGHGQPIKAVITDLSGTRMDCGVTSVTRTIVDLFARMRQITLTKEEASHEMGIRKDLQIKAILSLSSVREKWKAKHGVEPKDSDAARLFEYFPTIMMETLSRKEFYKPITGTEAVMHNLALKRIRVLSTTGFVTPMDIFLQQAFGKYASEHAVDASQVSTGRPTPEMVLLALAKSNIACSWAVKLGDTKSDIDEGNRANVWTVGLSLTSSNVGLTEEELAKMEPSELIRLNRLSVETLAQVQPHYIGSGMWDFWRILGQIDELARKGFHPFDFPVDGAATNPIFSYKAAILPE